MTDLPNESDLFDVDPLLCYVTHCEAENQVVVHMGNPQLYADLCLPHADELGRQGPLMAGCQCPVCDLARRRLARAGYVETGGVGSQVDAADITRESLAWDAYWAGTGSEDQLAAKALIELSDDVWADAVSWIRADHSWFREWIADVDSAGRSWPSTTSALFRVAAALSDPRREVRLADLAYTGSWETAVWQVLVEWGSGGNNRDEQARGRLRVTSTARAEGGA